MTCRTGIGFAKKKKKKKNNKNVWTTITRSEALERTWNIVQTRWTYINKGYSENEILRS